MQRAHQRRLERCRALFNQHLLDAESPLAITIDEGDFYISKDECQIYHKDYNGNAALTALADPEKNSYLTTRAQANTYFNDRDGAPVRCFKVVIETPTQTISKTDFYIQVYFLR